MKSSPESSAGNKKITSVKINYRSKIEGVVKTFTKTTLYLFVLLIFLISQQGFYALLHPEETN